MRVDEIKEKATYAGPIVRNNTPAHRRYVEKIRGGKRTPAYMKIVHYRKVDPGEPQSGIFLLKLTEFAYWAKEEIK